MHCIRSLGSRDHDFESHSGHGCLLFVNILALSGIQIHVQIQVQITLRLTVCQSVNLGVEPRLGLMTRCLLLLNVTVLLLVGRPLWREGRFLSNPRPQSPSPSHIATDGQSVSKSWCRAPSGVHDQIIFFFFLIWNFLSCSIGTPSLTMTDPRPVFCLVSYILHSDRIEDTLSQPAVSRFLLQLLAPFYKRAPHC
jgi:hypothetical protein